MKRLPRARTLLPPKHLIPGGDNDCRGYTDVLYAVTLRYEQIYSKWVVFGIVNFGLLSQVNSSSVLVRKFGACGQLERRRDYPCRKSLFWSL